MKKRSVRIAGHPTSISMEEEFWVALQRIAQRRNVSISQIIADIDETRGSSNLSSAIRLFVLKDLQDKT